ncbi:MAG TPA: isoprenylcysteine carboxylmethyltransferase family protein [Candidatus Marinimicrobia bacterium]|nr:isoprenylcysteine carboxylmethyltransferase family protein [Candidatus Neomarinimicrobiota bacterium]
MTGEHRFGDAGQASIAVLFLIVWLSDPLLLESTTHLNELIPRIIRFPIGIILLISAGYLAISTLKIVFGEVRKPPVVIREGAYKYCRHPMYLAEILLYLGLLIISISFAAFIVWLLAIGFLYFIGRHEEKLLLKRFGDEYRKYMAEVPMWIPRLKRN